MKASSSWTCPVCGEQVPVAVDVRAPQASRDAGNATLVVHVPDTALADVFAHAWTHLTSTDGDSR